jgi:hypothetical protein
MAQDHHYRKHERLIIRFSVILAVVVGILTILLATRLGDRTEKVSPEEVWAFIEEIAPQSDIDPEFVYAIAWAESSLDAKARSSVARGMMQITRPAWRDVTDESYRHAWDWRTNVRVGISYLAHCRAYLVRHGEFTYPLLAASYRYGPSHVRRNDFLISELDVPANDIYRMIFNGNIHPVKIPETLRMDK